MERGRERERERDLGYPKLPRNLRGRGGEREREREKERTPERASQPRTQSGTRWVPACSLGHHRYAPVLERGKERERDLGYPKLPRNLSGTVGERER